MIFSLTTHIFFKTVIFSMFVITTKKIEVNNQIYSKKKKQNLRIIRKTLKKLHISFSIFNILS